MNALDLAVEFEPAPGYTITPPPPLATPPPKRKPLHDDSPTRTPLKSSPQSLKSSPQSSKSSPQSSATTLSENDVRRTSTRASKKSLPAPATNQDRARRVGAPLSFAYGLLLGVLPFLIVIRFCTNRFRERDDDAPKLQERWFKYGRSTGLLVLLAIVIIVCIKLT